MVTERIEPKDVKDEDQIYVEEWKLVYSGLFCKNYKHSLLLKGMHTLYKVLKKSKMKK